MVGFAKVSALTGGLYILLSLPNLASDLGISRPERSLFLDVVDVSGSPHPWIFLSWWKVAIVVLLILGYAMAAVSWVRRGHRLKTVATVALGLATSALVALFHWHELSFGLRDPNRVYPNDLDKALTQFFIYFPGDEVGRTVVACLLQVVIAVVLLKAIPGDGAWARQKPA